MVIDWVGEKVCENHLWVRERCYLDDCGLSIGRTWSLCCNPDFVTDTLTAVDLLRCWIESIETWANI